MTDRSCAAEGPEPHDPHPFPDSCICICHTRRSRERSSRATDPPLTPALCSLCGHDQTEHVGCAHGWGPGSLAPGKGGCECDGPAEAEAELLALRQLGGRAYDMLRTLAPFVLHVDHDHGCDSDGWENRRVVAERAVEWIAEVDAYRGRAGDPPVVAEPD